MRSPSDVYPGGTRRELVGHALPTAGWVAWRASHDQADRRAATGASISDPGRHAAQGREPTFIGSVVNPRLPRVVQIKKVGEFEPVVTFAIGLNQYRGIRVLQLTNPNRLVVDIRH